MPNYWQAWPLQAKLKLLDELKKREAAKLLVFGEERNYNWHEVARPNQLPPEGEWRTWLTLAGRGFGKTRMGAEYVRGKVERGECKRFALIGPTAADTRDVMVEGESGILACSPPSFRPIYEPSKRRLTWPNGAIATTYSGDEPERLRGPQCLIGDTPVLMADGTHKAIADIRKGEYVLTRSGPKRVLSQSLTGRNADVYLLRTMGGRGIIGTAEHPVWVNGRGFLPLSSITKGMSLCAMPVLPGAAKFGISKETATTAHLFGFTAKFGKMRTGRYRPVLTSITRTGIRRTTGSKTWNFLRIASIARATLRRRLARIANSQLRTPPSLVRESDRPEWNGFFTAFNAAHRIIAGRVTLPASVPLTALTWRALELSAANRASASIAGLPIPQHGERNGSVRVYAMLALAQSAKTLWKFGRSCAHSVIARFSQVGPTLDSAGVSARSSSTDAILSVERLAKPSDVYDIAVEESHEFFAHGILVHNSDGAWVDEPASFRYPEAFSMMLFGLRLGDDPRVIVTGTPKPVKLIRELLADKSTAVTRGSSYDNRANLAAAFFESIVAKYEGTRLGRQELNAELLEDNPNALWQRGLIESLRVLSAPRMKRIVVAVDPAAGDGEHGAEAGIIVAGLGDDDHGYVLADRTVRGTPDEWARAAVVAYHAFKADRLLAETNNGGKMIEALIRTIDRNVAYKELHASRGKQARAEPIAALCEQKRIHHVGAFPELEDQLCEWVPGDESPDRMDAYVWAFTELMLGYVGGNPLAGGDRPFVQSPRTAEAFRTTPATSANRPMMPRVR